MGNMRGYRNNIDEYYDQDILDYAEDMLRPGVLDVIRFLYNRGYYIALFTATPPTLSEEKLKKQHALIRNLVDEEYDESVYEEIKDQILNSVKAEFYQQVFQRNGIEVSGVFS
jgi:phosphoserine phosphatase